MRKPYEKPSLQTAGDLATLTRGAAFDLAFDGQFFHRRSGGGGGGGS